MTTNGVDWGERKLAMEGWLSANPYIETCVLIAVQQVGRDVPNGSPELPGKTLEARSTTAHSSTKCSADQTDSAISSSRRVDTGENFRLACSSYQSPVTTVSRHPQ
jgi:hypothetical protein